MKKYQEVKPDIRRIIQFGRSNRELFELKVLEIHSLASRTPIRAHTDLHLFHSCLKSLNVLLSDAQARGFSAGRQLLLDKDDVQQAFNERGMLVKPISIYVPRMQWEHAVKVCKKMDWQLVLKTEKTQKMDDYVAGELGLSGHLIRLYVPMVL